MNILMLNPPFLKKFSRPQRSPAVTKSGTIYFPMWLAYATGVLEKEGFKVDLIDAPADGYDLDYIVDRTKKFQPKLIVLDTSTPSIYNDIKIGDKLKEIFPHSFVVLVGTHVSALSEETLEMSRGIDAVARREYDYTLRDLAKLIADVKLPTTDLKEKLEQIKGLSFKDGEEIIHNQDRPYIENLDEIPFVSEVYKKHLKIKNYFNPNALYPMVTIITSRGCPFRCTFCVYPQTLTGHKYRFRSIEKVVEEMEYIEKEFPEAKAVFFEDDTLTVSRSRCLELSELTKKRGLKISWTANSRADLDFETMKQMKASGCRLLCVGFESGDQTILNNMRKGIKRGKMFKFVEDAKRAGILIHGCFMVGLPGETRETMKQTLQLAEKLAPDTVQFYPVMIYPGTEAYNWYKERNLIPTKDYSKWLTVDGLHNCVIRTEDLSSRELVEFCDQARREFYLRPNYLFYKLWQVLKQPREIRRNFKAAKTFFKYLLRGSFGK